VENLQIIGICYLRHLHFVNSSGAYKDKPFS